MKVSRDTPLNPTVNDIARVAQVSLATVDRVLNERPGVRKVTVEKVNRAIAHLGYVRDTAAANLARGRIYRFLFILPATNNEFVDLLQQQIGDLSHGLKRERTQISHMRVPAFDPMALAEAINSLDPETVDGVAIFGPETPSVRDSISKLRRHGVSVVSLVSDIPSSERNTYVGIDNVAAGRTAAQLMGRFLGPVSGEILVLTGSMLARDHLERRLGFDEVIARDFPNLDVKASLEGRDDPDLIEKLLPQAFAGARNVIGIYSSAAGNAGLVRYLARHVKHPPPVIIAHELTPLSRRALSEGLFDAVISQDSGHLVRSAVRIMRANNDNVPINLAQERIRIDVYLKENLPPETGDQQGDQDENH
ncbi:LacI family DNA-binding transcriptional regulator [Roseobacter sp. YSTF-M11]|uniref:LacI family DNA-binding transcriptional regulator n=1 Tax=Roseobacter insulae TaxID=2859783 RepID=A0A9X1FTK3_9RHOB|nr:LacI family DNA-binding transcriptional regulator [Roseobacter insulae]MBW4706855.1 LacI family DNA-binding transcriptional regulator [Roseobacter insulae]